ncbi:uncharacterized protein MELLADRAFT_103252 [Melampsora larici-populina 98AG31]|uniref:Uncharacterized protein n=1 Tax=Melampsora larici-populina (strain 98AG31 / pathotype 3-4-7) TaxID=747676 RepID=F4RB16_MELLP|nr:uncharacterized protein MELLADRAFT_103252 [Melampsora larici-populina 98AG31]EGG10571.1 hypothetical protein MELLADRAFT_103252 [Melampsora larici-populina 98AG31]
MSTNNSSVMAHALYAQCLSIIDELRIKGNKSSYVIVFNKIGLPRVHLIVIPCPGFTCVEHRLFRFAERSVFSHPQRRLDNDIYRSSGLESEQQTGTQELVGSVGALVWSVTVLASPGTKKHEHVTIAKSTSVTVGTVLALSRIRLSSMSKVDQEAKAAAILANVISCTDDDFARDLAGKQWQSLRIQGQVL